MLGFVKNYLNQPEWRRQHRWRKAIWHAMSSVGLTGLHALPLNRRWVEIARVPMPLKGLDQAFEGFKIVQLSDLHYSPVVWSKYLIQHIRWVNDLDADLVVVTGDLITGGYRYAHRVATILSHLKARHGVICTLGNHDYSLYGGNKSTEGRRRADFLENCLTARGLRVLRNETEYLRLDGAIKPLAIVGLDDEWSGHIDPVKGFCRRRGRAADHLPESQPGECVGSDGVPVAVDAGRPHPRPAARHQPTGPAHFSPSIGGRTRTATIRSMADICM